MHNYLTGFFEEKDEGGDDGWLSPELNLSVIMMQLIYYYISISITITEYMLIRLITIYTILYYVQVSKERAIL